VPGLGIGSGSKREMFSYDVSAILDSQCIVQIGEWRQFGFGFEFGFGGGGDGGGNNENADVEGGGGGGR